MTEKITKSLRLVDLLADLPESFLQQLTRFSMLRKIRAGETIFCQGEPSPYCFGILSGQVTIQRVSRDKNFAPKVLSVLGPGSLFGEQALFKECPRIAMAVASQDGELVAIQGKQFRDWIEKEATAGVPLLMGVLQNTLSRLRQTNQELSLVYGVGRFMASEKPIKERLQEAIDFVRSSLEDLDEIAVYQRNPYWDEFQPLTALEEGAEKAESSVLPVDDPLVRQVDAVLRPVISEAEGTQVTALIPFLDLESPKKPLLGFLKVSSQKNPFAFSPKVLMLLVAVCNQIAEALLRQGRQDDQHAKDRLHQGRQSYPL